MIPVSRSRSRIPRTSSQSQRRRYAADDKTATRRSHMPPKTFGRQSKRPPPRPMGGGLWNPLPTRSLTHPLFEEQHRANSERIHKERDKLKLGGLTEKDVGTVKSLGNDRRNVVKAYGVPRNVLKEFRLQTTPTSVIRYASLQIQSIISSNTSTPSSSQENRYVITGPSGSGKSHVLLQALSLAQPEKASKDGWIVLSFPRCGNLINGSTAYAYDARTKTFTQAAFASETLLRMWTANEELFGQLKTSKEWVFVGGAGSSAESASATASTPLGKAKSPSAGEVVNKGSNLKALMDVGSTRESGLGAAVLEAVFEEIATQTKFPVLLAVDELEALYSDSKYKTPAFHTIKAWHLSMPRLLLEYVSGKKSFSNGVVLAATSAQHAIHSPPHLASLLSSTDRTRPIDPYSIPLRPVEMFSQGLKPIQVGTLDVKEAMGVFEIWREERILGAESIGAVEKGATDAEPMRIGLSGTAGRASGESTAKLKKALVVSVGMAGAGDEKFLGTYAESGGNARQFVWKGLLSSLAG